MAVKRLTSLVGSLGLDTARWEAGLSRATKSMDRWARRTRRTMRRMKRELFSVQGALQALAGGLVARGVVSTIVEFEKLEASLRTVTGSATAAKGAFAEINKFAQTTPFQVQEVTSAFIKLKALGLDPSMDALRSYGNTASAMGKSLNQFIEAVADAATGEFERLKEFGIKARSQGDKVSFTFQGVTTTIGKNAQEIEQYLRRIGEVQFEGAMEEQMNTLGGAFSNLKDSFSRLAAALGKAGLSDALKTISKWIADIANKASKFSFKGFFASFFATIDKGVAFAVKVWDAGMAKIGFVIETAIAGWKIIIGEFLAKYAQGLSFIPGMGDISRSINAVSEGLLGAAASVEPLENRLKRINEEYERQVRIADRTVQQIVAAEQQKQEAIAQTAEVTRQMTTSIAPPDEKLQQDLERLQQSLKDRETIEVEAWFNRQAILDEAFAQGLLKEQQYKMLTEQLEKFHQDKLTKIAMAGMTQRQKFAAMTAKQQTKTVLGELLNLTSGVAQHDKKMFQLNKAAGIANAVINTYEGVTNALAAYPPPISFAMAAAQLAAGLAQVNAIKSQTFTGGGGVSPSVAGTTGATGTVATVPAATQTRQAGTRLGDDEQNQRIIIELDGDKVGEAVVKRAEDGRLTIPERAVNG